MGKVSATTNIAERNTSYDSTKNPHPSEFVEFVSLGPGTGGLSVTVPNVALQQTERLGSHSDIPHDDVVQDFYSNLPEDIGPSRDAHVATDKERKMTFYSGCRLYPKAIAWSTLLSSAIIMEGYGTTLINSFYAFPAFLSAYGSLVREKGSSGEVTYQIPARWQAALSNAPVAGEIIGLLLNGILTDRFGHRWTMIGMLVMLSLFVFPAFFASNIEMILVSQVLCGIPWGAFQTLATTYAAEIMPVQMRAYLLSNVNMCWLIGQMLGVAVMRGLVYNSSQWSYRIPFGVQWAFAVSILLGVIRVPETPWWLIRHGRLQEAKTALSRLTTKNSRDINIDESLAMMKHTNEVERSLHSGSTSFLECFRGTNLRRTEICCMVYGTQTMSGSTLTGFAAYFYEQAGVGTQNSFTLAVGMYALAIVGGMISWFLLPRIGRRRLYLTGSVVSFCILITAGIIGTLPPSKSTAWAVASLLILLTFAYDMTLGPVCYVLVAEIPSTRLRVKTVVLARATYNAISIAMNIGTSHMLNPAVLNWRGKTCFFYAATCALSFIWCYIRLPESQGLSYLELDILFEKRAKAKKFKQFQANLASTGYFSLTGSGSAQGGWSGY